jgi:hypothetical protein
MKKLLLLSMILLTACDENSNSTQSNNTNTTGGLLNSLTQRDVEYFKINDVEREAIVKKCVEDFTNKKFTKENTPPECIQAGHARIQVQITTQLNGEISVEGFKKNRARNIGTDVEAAFFCRANNPSIPHNNPICKAVIEYARQLKTECTLNNTSCTHSDELLRRLEIKE